MKKISVLMVFLFVSISYSQITIINTGTSDNLYSISVIKNNILVSGSGSYLAKSYNECNTMIPVNTPTFAEPEADRGYQIFRVDTNVMYMNYAAVPYISKIWRTSNGGTNWVKKYDITVPILVPQHVGFFDTLNGIAICDFNKTMLTTNGFNTYSVGAWNNQYSTCMQIWGDSTIMFGEGTYIGSIYISKNRGNSWLNVGPPAGMYPPSDLAFLNKDTLFGIANPPNWGDASFVKSLDGGVNWNSKILSDNAFGTQPKDYFLKVRPKKATEVYVLARNGLTGNGYTGYGVILKTVDLGQTWSRFTTPFVKNLNDMKFINDSIALVCGDNGLLFKFNTKTAQFVVGVKENNLIGLPVSIFPNPVKNKLSLQFEQGVIDKINIMDCLGQIVYTLNNPLSKQEIDLSAFASGIYFLTVQSKTQQRVFKIIKE